MNTHLTTLWSRLSGSRRTLMALSVVGLFALAAVFAELLAADAPIFATGPQGTVVLPAIVDPAAYEGLEPAEIEARHAADKVLWPVVRFGPQTETAFVLADPTAAHPLGTDERGRDLFARLVYGARTALGLSLFAVSLGMVFGVVLGGLAGHYRRFWNDRLTRLVETVDTFPAIIVVALVRAIEQEPSALSLVIAVAIVRWAEVARLVRVTVLKVSAEDYVLAAQALGNPPRRVLYRHVLPNAIGPAIVSSVFGVASVILLEASISFLEMGGPVSYATWGETLAQASRHPDVPLLLAGPGLLLMAIVGCTYLVADALRDAIDPRSVRFRGTDASPLSRVASR